MAHLADFNIENKFKAKVRETKRLTPKESEEIREILLEITDPEFEVKVDQSFGVLVQAKSDFGNTLHHRLYSVADLPGEKNGKQHITMLVKRCSYVDEFSGELYQGVASNYLCDRKVGDEITITGPHSLPFVVPEDKTSDLILVGMGTGIAPFRAFVKHIYKNVKDWKGKIRLLYGARTGLELLYMNEKRDDFTNYYDEDTFEAFKALSPRPNWSDPIAWDQAIEDRADEIWNLLEDEHTHVYVAGQQKIRDSLDALFSGMCGSAEGWAKTKAGLVEEERWVELLY